MIAATLLTWALLGQSGGGFAGPSGFGLDLSGAARRPGDPDGLADAADRARVAFVGRAIAPAPGVGPGPDRVAFRPAERLRGRPRDLDPAGLGLVIPRGAESPEIGADYVVFASSFHHPAGAVDRLLPATPAAIEAARRAIRDADARTLPADTAPGAEPHTLVVAEVAAGALMDAGGVGLGWAELKVLAAIRGDGAAVAGRRLDYTTYRGKQAPAPGRPYLVAIGRREDRDAILSFAPATPAAVDAATRVEADRRAIRAGDPRRLVAPDPPLDAAAARAHAIVVATVTMAWPVAEVHGLAGSALGLEVTATLKGSALPGDRLDLGYAPAAHGIGPLAGESFLVFIARDGDRESILKLLPATPEHVAATCDQIMTAATPVAPR